MAQEKNFEKQIRKFLESNGCYVVKQFGCAFSKAGVPDLLCCVNGHFLAVEVKASNGRPSALQEFNIKKIIAANGRALILYPKDFDRFKQMVMELLQDDKRI